jgi:hypothetical protein
MRFNGDLLGLFVLIYEQGLYEYHHHPKETNPPLKNFSEADAGPTITTTINRGEPGPRGMTKYELWISKAR